MFKLVTFAILMLIACTARASADPTADAVARYQAAIAAQIAPPGPDVQATPALIDAAHGAILDVLKDPASIRWGSLRFFQVNDAGQVEACGQANAKNSFGGYGGEVPFTVKLQQAGAAWQVILADMASPAREGLFYTAHPTCNPLGWRGDR